VLFRIIVLLGMIISLSNSTIIEILDVGKTYPFAEKDFLQEIQEYIKTHKSQIETKLTKIRKEQIKKVKQFKPKGIDPLTPATRNRVFYPDMTYTLQFDIKDQYGKILYPKGYKFNPTKYVHLSYGIIIINGKREKEIKWLLKNKNKYLNTIAYKVFLTDGSWYEVSQKLKQPVFYCLKEIEDRFQLQHTPSIIIQKNGEIEVREICLECNSTKKGET